MKAEEVKNINWEQFNGESGFEDLSTKDLGVPYLSIAQALSKIKKKSSDKYNAKVQEGDIYNNVSSDILWSEGQAPLPIIICKRDWCRVEWQPRDKGGELVGVHALDDETILKTVVGTKPTNKFVLVTSNGTELVETIYLSCAYKKGDNWYPCIISLQGSQIKKWQRVLDLMRNVTIPTKKGAIQAPMYAMIFNLTTKEETKNDNTWYGWNFEYNCLVQEQQLLLEAQSIRAEKSNLLLLASSDDVVEVVDDGKGPF